ncbi:alpha/beta fold hydrolase [Sphingomonas sp.]|uniref:alpha/beta fold hydrolase n=1 Tax=Sphingomonas sp. TaxID=28214 RepID=UPI00286CAA0B|nr:alpha/beta fold hydrolase [Sphingomonas sp.]
MIEQRRVALSTGIVMNVATAGPADAPPVIFVHGFPESHRTWRDLVPLLDDKLRLIMPDLRGFGATDKPQDVADYSTEILVADLFALADAMNIDRFALVGHDWGGAIAWAAAIGGNSRIERLAIINSPHPAIFQRSLIDHSEQRAASQYMNAFRTPGMEQGIARMGLDTFFDKSFTKHVDLASIPAEERASYIADWGQPGALTAMLNWYRASRIAVPAPGEQVAMPDWVDHVPRIHVPVRVIWGLDDAALLPVQLEGIGEVGDDVSVFPLADVGHFAPWQAPDQVAADLRPFLMPA